MGCRKNLIATDLLPEELLRRVSDFLDGRAAHLWVPSREGLNRQKRDKYIEALSKKGCSTAEIAERLCISARQVQRILLAKKKAAHMPSRAHGGGG